jgi:hypothetical protein
MSAFIVENDLIDALLSYAIDHRLSYWNPGAKTRVDVTAFNAEEVGRILLDENVASVGYRYEGRIDADEKNSAPSYRFRRYTRPLGPVEIIKAVHCLEYQSCEHPGWEASLAWRICQEIKSKACHELPGYDAANWGAPSRHPPALPPAHPQKRRPYQPRLL